MSQSIEGATRDVPKEEHRVKHVEEKRGKDDHPSVQDGEEDLIGREFAGPAVQELDGSEDRSDSA